MTASRTNDQLSVAEHRLSIALRAMSIVFLVFFGAAFFGVLFEIRVPDPLPMMLRWGHGGEAYELMIASIYIVWAVFLWRAARDPLANRTFLDFTVAANAVHFGLMLIQGILMHGEHTHLVGDILLMWIVLIPVAILWLLVRRDTEPGT
ncbi:hypothetical protein OG203_05395 [Nocardia sp. NBC_01499]|uniref:DUF6632 domain-containing protein n=1 Tax=Nocardia sp. NBC_01499 TaxID=2903597 RepID=UPI00386D06C9